MNKKNLPNIPIYIGDWERDCNVLSLESEAAWMRIVFKLWTKGKQNTIKIPTKSLQNLWRCSADKMREILDDLIFNEIAEIAETKGFVEFSCRRFVKENKLSKIRSDAVKSGKNKNKTLTNTKQNLNKIEQNADNDNDNVNVNGSIEVLSAYEFLKKETPEIIEVFEMQNKSSFKDYDIFKINFNSKVITEELEFRSDLLFARLQSLNANWHKEEIKKMDSDVMKKVKNYD